MARDQMDKTLLHFTSRKDVSDWSLLLAGWRVRRHHFFFALLSAHNLKRDFGLGEHAYCSSLDLAPRLHLLGV